IDNVGDKIVDAGGNNEVEWNLATSLILGSALLGIENAVLLGMAPIGAAGDGVANRLEGNDGANKLTGADGGDTLIGHGGNDTLDGRTGIDSMQGGAGNDTYVVTDSNDVVDEAATDGGSGIDVVLSSATFTLGDGVENLTLTGLIGNEALNGTGNDVANVLTGNAGNNQMIGGAGNDTITGGAGNDTLDGATGADKMVGGDGDDTYFVDDAKNMVIEAAGPLSGHDTVESKIVSYTLPVNVEDLVLMPGAVNGTGNTLDNKITGNAADNLLSGLA